MDESPLYNEIMLKLFKMHPPLKALYKKLDRGARRNFVSTLLFPAAFENQLLEPEGGPIMLPVEIRSVYGQGTYALVLQIIDARGRIFALRVTTSSAESSNNIAIQIALAKQDMAPHVYYISNLDIGLDLSVMDPITTTLEDVLKTWPLSRLGAILEALQCLLDKKILMNLLHGDMHDGNIAVLKDGRTLGFIDYDYSIFIPDNGNILILDFIPLLASVATRVGGASDKLVKGLVEYYKDTYKITLDPKRVKPQEMGGYYYQGKDNIRINSYLKIDENSNWRFVTQIFEGIVPPIIV